MVFSSGITPYLHEFTLGYYSGFQISIDLDVAQKSIDLLLGKNIINLLDLKDKVVDNSSFVIIRSNDEIEHVISELYSVDDNIKEGYYKIKVMELLLFLKNSTFRNLDEEYPTLNSDNVAIIKKIKSYLVNHIADDVTLDDLSGSFNLSKTSIKNYFKMIYGMPLFTWRREYRLTRAADYLMDTSMNVGEISELVGYRNHGKFSDAFKQYFT